MSTYILKRRSFSSTNEIKGENVGDSIGGSVGGAVGGTTGAVAGGVGAGLIGAGVGATKGWKAASKNNQLVDNVTKATKSADSMAKSMATASQRGVSPEGINRMAKEVAKSQNAKDAAIEAAKKAGATNKISKVGSSLKKAGKFGAIATATGLAAGAILGRKSGESAGRSVGTNVGGAIGSGIDSATSNQKTYSISRVTKSVYGAAKSVTPKSKRMNLARKAVNTDKKIKEAAFEMSTNPGGLAKKGVEYVGKHPIQGSMQVAGNLYLPGVPGTGATSIAVGGRLDKLGRKHLPGLYKSIEKAGNFVSPIARDATNAAYNLAKNI